MSQSDNPEVIIFPPLLFGIAFLTAAVGTWMWPLPILAHPGRIWAGVAFLSFGIVLGVSSAMSLRKGGTNISPAQPTTAIITSGPFRFSRNPLYIAGSLDFIGLSVIFNSLWGLLTFVPLLILMHYGVILKEERYLEAKFGESYRRYCSTVRRYL